ncbi:sigma factor-like helix-turn-helix DNA-binding protein [Terrabacter aeriphilus]|uniref:sigma factor-like helix-turn-helix DNA-binding protein n=1 Tax=Terrabacter aeriphilus TaxID=515662 RepID=UPI0031E550D9
MRDAVGELPLLQQQLIHLRFTQELTQREVADLLQLTPMAVSRLQRRVLDALAERLLSLAPGSPSA